MAKILIIEDDVTLRTALSQYLKASGFFVVSAENGFCALEVINDAPFDLIISDIRMPGLDGVTTITKIKESYPHIKTILITGYSDDTPLVRALNLGVDAILKKPFGMRELLNIISIKLAEKEKEEARQKEEHRLKNALAKAAKMLPEEALAGHLGRNFRLAAAHEDADRIASLIEVGRMAEMRQEPDASILAYEKALSLLAGLPYEKEEVSIRLALSKLFAQKNELEVSISHALEALSLAEELHDSPGAIEARLLLTKILFTIEPEKAYEHLLKAQELLDEHLLNDKQALAFLLFSGFAFEKKEYEKTSHFLSKFIALGRRHFLPQALVSIEEIALIPFLFSLPLHPERENLMWILEESAPYLQSRLKELLKLKPDLTSAIIPFIFTNDSLKQPILHIYGFGKLTMFLKNDPLLEEQWNTSKGLSIFLLLFHEHPNLVSDERILDMFWPKIDVIKGRHTFRTTLYLVRRALGHEAAKSLIYNEKQKYGIRADSGYYCDFLSFREAHQEAKTLWKQGEIDRATFLLKESDKLYKETFLQGWSDHWVLAARDYYKDAFLWNTMVLANHSRKQKIWHEALTYSQRALMLDPTLEEAHCLTIESLLELGRRDDAVKQFHVCKDSLKNELSISPSERLRKLYWRAIEERKTVHAI